MDGSNEIAQELMRRNMTNWIPVLDRWLGQYLGLEQHIPCEDEFPCNQVLQAIRKLPERVDDSTLAQHLSRLDFLCWRARHADGERWQPLRETFLHFAARGQVYCWQWDTERPEPPETEAWLLAQLRNSP